MKKNAIIGKKQILTVAMVLALGAAVWLNVSYSTNGTNLGGTRSKSDAELGNAQYVANTSVVSSEEEDYFKRAQKDREKTRNEAVNIIKKTLNSAKATSEQKTAATDKVSEITERMEMENSAESLIKAKGFSDVIVVLSGDSCNVVVRKDGELEQSETVQILDIISGTAKINLENIKIVAVK
jgi:stage III sporulation protein AH